MSMTDDDALAAGYCYKLVLPSGKVLRARTAREANDLQRKHHSHTAEAPEVILLKPFTTERCPQHGDRYRCIECDVTPFNEGSD